MSIIKNIKILLVDDPASMRNTIRGLIKDLGYGDVLEVNSSSSVAPELLKTTKIDLIISDWLPQNHKLFNEIKGEVKSKAIPIMIISADAKREQIVEAAELGVKSYLVTPINRNLLQEKIEKIFNKVK